MRLGIGVSDLRRKSYLQPCRLQPGKKSDINSLRQLHKACLTTFRLPWTHPGGVQVKHKGMVWVLTRDAPIIGGDRRPASAYIWMRHLASWEISWDGWGPNDVRVQRYQASFIISQSHRGPMNVYQSFQLDEGDVGASGRYGPNVYCVDRRERDVPLTQAAMLHKYWLIVKRETPDQGILHRKRNAS